MEASMALQAQLPAFSSNKQHPVSGPVRIVTRRAPFDFRCRVFVNKRSTLLDVTLSTGLRCCLDETRRVQCAVSVVAVRTLHQSFWNTMVSGLRDLSSSGGMTGVGDVGVGAFVQAVFKPSVIVRSLRHLEDLLLAVLKS